MNAIALPYMQPMSEAFLDELKRTARNIKKLTGYKGVTAAIKDQELFRYLIEIGCPPFDRKAVDEYKDKKIQEARQQNPHGDYWWHSRRLNEYTSPVPLQVLTKAALINQQYKSLFGSAVSLRVESFREDPFLSVQFWSEGHQKFYIAVWDEPDFNAKSL